MADKQPNIVFILCDNVGWGDFACYGGQTPTPRIDKLASEGIRFNAYTTESQCCPTRTALLTGRQSVRCGTYSVIPSGGPSGLVPWEYTIAELLSDAGYATSLWGKWHLGQTEGRLPTDQGFDEWWGYKNSADECGYSSYATFRALAKKVGIDTPKLWQGKKGEKSEPVGELDLKVRPLLDEKIVDHATDYIKRAAAGDKPFYTYIALSHVHPPERAHPDFDQTDPTRLGLYADLMAEMDHRVGQIVDCVEGAGIADNTVIVFCSDNSTCDVPAFGLGGSTGPWRGDFTRPPGEGSMRAPAIVRMPGKTAPRGVVTDEMLACHDWYKTFAALAGASDKVPTDRPMDGVDASKFLLGESQDTSREFLLFFGGDGELMSVRWHNLKIWLRYCEGFDKPYVTPSFPMFFDLGSDPQEHFSLFDDKLDCGWELAVALKLKQEYEKSIEAMPNIKPGTKDNFNGYGLIARGEHALEVKAEEKAGVQTM
jgi:arylsulfatase A-like enzyme